MVMTVTQLGGSDSSQYLKLSHKLASNNPVIPTPVAAVPTATPPSPDSPGVYNFVTREDISSDVSGAFAASPTAQCYEATGDAWAKFFEGMHQSFKTSG